MTSHNRLTGLKGFGEGDPKKDAKSKALKKKARDPHKEYKVTEEAKFHHELDKSLHKYDIK